MKTMKWIRATGTLSLVAAAAIANPCAASPDEGWYVGGNAGQSRSKIDDARIASRLAAGGFATNSITDDDRSIGYKIFGGYQFSPYFAVEGGYFDLGKFSFDATTTPPGTLHGDIKLKGVNLDAVALLPLASRVSVFGRGGVNYAEAKDRFAGTGAVNVPNPNRSQRATNYKFGGGLQFALTGHLGLRVEAERYRVDDAVGNKGDIDLFSAGLLYRFGGPEPAPAPRAMAPAPVIAPAPEPPPVAMAPAPPPPPPPPVPAPVLPTRVSFSADSLFDFDRATVKPAGKQELDALAANLRGARYEIITVTGHTDRIGPHDYNMKLSAQRAEAVKAYLMESAGIPAGKIVARGVDGADPVTKPGACTGKEHPVASPGLIACLQPDRRVEVEVSGTR